MALKHVQPGSFLTLHYRLAGPDGGDLVNTFGDRPATLSLGTGDLAPAMESRLLGLAEGTRSRFELAAGEAFGERNPELLQRVALSLLETQGDAGASYVVGDVLQFAAPAGQGTYTGVIRRVDDHSVLLDFNHPLAGRPVTFEVELIGVL